MPQQETVKFVVDVTGLDEFRELALAARDVIDHARDEGGDVYVAVHRADLAQLAEIVGRTLPGPENAG